MALPHIGEPWLTLASVLSCPGRRDATALELMDDAGLFQGQSGMVGELDQEVQVVFAEATFCQVSGQDNDPDGAPFEEQGRCDQPAGSEKIFFLGVAA